MRLFFSYIQLYRKGFALFLLFSAVLSISFALYDLPLAAVWYPLLLCVVIGLVFSVFDFIFFYKRHKNLVLLLNEITVTTDSLPAPVSVLDKDYMELIRAVHRDKMAFVCKMDEKYRSMMEYYTIWAHQIKTPIAAMRLLLTRNDSPESAALLEELTRIEQYVEMVLNYLRLDSESTDYVIREYDLDGIVKQAVRKYAAQFISRRLPLVYEPLDCRVLTDEKWLLFVIEQILSNALKYTRTGEISISMETPKVLCVRDTGIGIDQSDLPRIFEKGYTGYNGREDKKSTGIGLYLCRRILEKMGNTITITSEVGKGTAVYIDLRSAELEVE